ncbi:MAG: LacI family DNA-binding transcriptional regulator [Opitutaceae bacterium]|jgi:LacI family transcriptional regulator
MSKETGMTPRQRRGAPEMPTRKKRATMRDIARLAGGVHPSTVSLALCNHPSISLATRKRIQAVAKAVGYRRDPLLDAFNARRLVMLPHRIQPVIAFVADFESRDALENSPHHAALWRSAAAAGQSLYCRLELFLIGRGGLTAERLDSILHTRGIDLLVAAALPAGIAQLHVAWDRYCAVKIDCFDWEVPGHTIAADLRQGMRLAVGKARNLGYRRIGLAMARVGEVMRNDLLKAGYLIEQHQDPGEQQIPFLFMEEQADPRVLEQWIRTHQVDAVLSNQAGFGDMLKAAGFTGPSNVAWACLDVTNTGADVAGMVMPDESVGSLAVEQVVYLSRTNQRGIPPSASFTFVSVGWRDGASLPPRSVEHPSHLLQ